MPGIAQFKQLVCYNKATDGGGSIMDYESLIKENAALKAENASLREIIAALLARIEELEARLNKNSGNSNKPPSSDGLGKKIKNSRVKSGKPSGGQPGHTGSTKQLTPVPDKIIRLTPQSMCACGGEILIENDDFIIRQVRDIVPIKLMTVEYRGHKGKCTCCGKEHKAAFPQGVESTISYGEHLQAILTYLNSYQLIPLKRTCELMEDLFGEKVSQGTIINNAKKAYDALSETEARIKAEIIQSNVVGFDESGMRVNGRTHWLHTASTESLTMHTIHKKRGKEAMEAMGILPAFEGTAIHDHWICYYHYQCAHGECNEHHLRHLKYLHENLREEWAQEMVCLLLRIKRHVDLSRIFGAKELSLDIITEYEGMYRIILEAAGEMDTLHIEAKRMIKRMTKYEQETLLFMYDFDVPFTNNLTERDMRMPKVKQKISGGFRSEDGANAFARIRGYISTVKKRGKSIFEGLTAVFTGEALGFIFPVHDT
jgi:transposase